jgi:hypothetical protein
VGGTRTTTPPSRAEVKKEWARYRLSPEAPSWRLVGQLLSSVEVNKLKLIIIRTRRCPGPDALEERIGKAAFSRRSPYIYIYIITTTTK